MRKIFSPYICVSVISRMFHKISRHYIDVFCRGILLCFRRKTCRIGKFRVRHAESLSLFVHVIHETFNASAYRFCKSNCRIVCRSYDNAFYKVSRLIFFVSVQKHLTAAHRRSALRYGYFVLYAKLPAFYRFEHKVCRHYLYHTGYLVFTVSVMRIKLRSRSVIRKIGRMATHLKSARFTFNYGIDSASCRLARICSARTYGDRQSKQSANYNQFFLHTAPLFKDCD